MTRILYLVHDLGDAAVERRVGMFIAGGANVAVAGFYRGAGAPREIAGSGTLALGRTQDGALVRRVLSIAGQLIGPSAVEQLARTSDVIVARNLEMLILAHRIRRPGQRVIYECLDIHRIMLGGSIASAAPRGLERSLVRRSSLVIVSSPAFDSHYFTALQRAATPRLLVENKLFPGEATQPRARSTASETVRIGWFGNLRCRRSLAILKDVASDRAGIEILVAGRPSPAEFPRGGAEFEAPGIEFAGPYAARDLPDLYGRCDFAWCVDYFEEGLNSEWLLPNRIYEAVANRVIPIAREGTQTAAWLTAHEVGVIVPRDGERDFLVAALGTMSARQRQALQRAVDAVPGEAVVASVAECRALVEAL